jgi:hypothetical protein
MTTAVPVDGPLPNLAFYGQGGAPRRWPGGSPGHAVLGAGPAADKVGLPQPRRKPIRRLDHPSSDIARFLIFSEVIVLAATTVMIAPKASSDEPINLRKRLAGSLMQMEIPESMPRATTRSSTDRVETR